MAVTTVVPSNGDITDAGTIQQVYDDLTGHESRLTAIEALTKYVRKSADETLSNSSTLQNDDQLTLAVAASTVYEWHAIIVYGASTTADFKIAWTYPTGCTLDMVTMGLDTTGALGETVALSLASATSRSYGGAGVASFRFVEAWGTLTVATTAGSFQLQWAQDVATVENTVCKAGSILILRKVA